MTIAAPTAWTARAATSAHTVGAAAHRAEATVNTASPTRNSLRWPNRSARRPASARKAAKTTV